MIVMKKTGLKVIGMSIDIMALRSLKSLEVNLMIFLVSKNKSRPTISVMNPSNRKHGYCIDCEKYFGNIHGHAKYAPEDISDSASNVVSVRSGKSTESHPSKDDYKLIKTASCLRSLRIFGILCPET